jgi:catalase-peroxidase
LYCKADYPDPFKPNVFHRPKMMTSDIGLKMDPVYHEICKKFLNDFDLFTEKFGYVSVLLLPLLTSTDPIIYHLQSSMV